MSYPSSVRLCIILALTGQKMTAGELDKKLLDVSRATIYRHLNKLANFGLIDVVEEHRVRNTIEKIYSLAEASKQDHMRFFYDFYG